MFCQSTFHIAVTLSPTKEALKSIIQAYPKGIQFSECVLGRLPIHLACINCKSAEVIRFLLSKYPDGAEKVDKKGSLPLHYACSNRADPEIIKILLSAYPNGAKVRDDNGWLPLHVACLRGAPSKSLRVLLKFYPESVLIGTKNNSLPKDLTLPGYDNFSQNLSLLENQQKKLTA